jgi:hypothetical protein
MGGFQSALLRPPELTLDTPCERRFPGLSFLPPPLWVPLGQSESHRHVPVYRHHVPLDDCYASRGLAVYPRPAASFVWLPAPLMPSATWGQGKIGYRHAESVEIGLLDSGQRLRELALAPDFEHYHRRKFGHHHERCGLLGGLLVPPHQRVSRRLHVDPQRSLHQTPQQQRQQ